VLTKWHPEGECWISDYSLGSHGYAQVGWSEHGIQKATTAHRVSWWAAHQREIDEGMTVDHTCRRRPCVNPLHLRLIPNSQNASDNGMRRLRTNEGTGRSCQNGHPMIRSATSGKTYCRECQARRKRERRKF
jgi:hypothetical protein